MSRPTTPLPAIASAQPLDAARLWSEVPEGLKTAYRIIRRAGEHRARRVFLALLYPEKFVAALSNQADCSVSTYSRDCDAAVEANRRAVPRRAIK